MSDLSDFGKEIIWAESTTGEDFQCVHVDYAREMRAEIDHLRAQLARARKALDLAEYVSRKDSLTENERLQSVRTVVCAAISSLSDEKGDVT